MTGVPITNQVALEPLGVYRTGSLQNIILMLQIFTVYLTSYTWAARSTCPSLAQSVPSSSQFSLVGWLVKSFIVVIIASQSLVAKSSKNPMQNPNLGFQGSTKMRDLPIA